MSWAAVFVGAIGVPMAATKRRLTPARRRHVCYGLTALAVLLGIGAILN